MSLPSYLLAQPYRRKNVRAVDCETTFCPLLCTLASSLFLADRGPNHSITSLCRLFKSTFSWSQTGSSIASPRIIHRYLTLRRSCYCTRTLTLSRQQNPSNAGPHGLPRLHLQHQHHRPPGLIQQYQRPVSPRQSHQIQSVSQQQPPQSYISPRSSANSLPYRSQQQSHHQEQQQQQQQQQHQSPFIGPGSAINTQHPSDSTFYTAHPSPYSNNSAPGSFASSGDSMATQAAAMNRQHYPSITSYHTPQSNSPASIHSPQTNSHGRPLFPMAPMPSQIHYPYSLAQPSPYAQHPGSFQQSNMTSAPSLLLSHSQQQLTPPQQQQQQQHHHTHQQSATVDSKPAMASLHRQQSLGPLQGSPPTPSALIPPGASRNNSSAAPGPIPATTPLVVRQDSSGVQWIAFEYSRDRVKMQYTIRCDVESVNVDDLDSEFKSSNCVYPRACCAKDQYKGNRLHYESECNAVGWALAQLNPNLRDKRGLIQRAVDSWRNSNQDPRLRSRRVRRMAKINTRNANKPAPIPGQFNGLPSHAGYQTPHNMTSGSVKLPNPAHSLPQFQHHHHHPDPNDTGEGGDVSVSGISRQLSDQNAAHLPSSTLSGTPNSQSAARYTQHFFPAYPQNAGIGASTMPLVRDSMDPLHDRASILATPASRSEDAGNRYLYGDIPDSKQRKFILIDDPQRHTRSRIRVTLHDLNLDDMPDSHLHMTAVFPRSYFPRQMRSPSDSPHIHQGAIWDDDDDDVSNAASGTVRRTMVNVPLMDGRETQLPIPTMTKSRRQRESALNELGNRMSWAQPRTFSGRSLFLQRALDAFRNKQWSSVSTSGRDINVLSPHLETRPGKRKWLERLKHREHMQM